MKMRTALVGALALASLTTPTLAEDPMELMGNLMGKVKEVAERENMNPMQYFTHMASQAHDSMEGVEAQDPQEWTCPTHIPSKMCDLLPLPYFRIFPAFVGQVYKPHLPKGQPHSKAKGFGKHEGLILTWSTPCFKQNKAWLRKVLGQNVVHFESWDATTDEYCEDYYQLGISEWTIMHQVVHKAGHQGMVKGTSTILAALNKHNIEWFRREGVRIFRFLDGKAQTAANLKATLKVFKTDEEGPAVAQAPMILEILKKYGHEDYKERAKPVITPIPKSDIKDGTTLAVFRPDGTGVLQIWACGAQTNHIVTAMRFNGTLYAVESTDKTSYWTHHNIQMTEWDEWLGLAHRANYSILLLPLKEEYQRKFDAGLEQAQSYVKKTIGLPYGYHNFLLGFWDTPSDNLPAPANWVWFEVIFTIFDKLDRKIANKMWNQALNFRLSGTWETQYTTTIAANKAAEKGMTFGELMSIPEKDSWVYNDGPSMVCDVYACSIYREAGLFGGVGKEFSCTEFQNRDLYSLSIFDNNATLPKVCTEYDPTSPFCALMGEWLIPIKYVGTIDPYPKMNDHCPIQPPKYTRPEGC